MAIDESHNFKNLFSPSQSPGLAIGGSQKATDMLMKLNYLREATGERPYCLFSSGTPISNSIAESHTVMRLIAPHVLESTGTESIDSFGGRGVTEP